MKDRPFNDCRYYISSRKIIKLGWKKTKNFLSKYDWINVFDRKKHLAGDDVLDLLIGEVPRICNGKYIFWSHITSPLFNEKCYLDFIQN